MASLFSEIVTLNTKGDLTEGSFNSKEKVKKMFSDIIDKSTRPQYQHVHNERKSSTRHDVQTSDHDKELKALGFVAKKKKKLFDDDVISHHSCPLSPL